MFPLTGLTTVYTANPPDSYYYSEKIIIPPNDRAMH